MVSADEDVAALAAWVPAPAVVADADWRVLAASNHAWLARFKRRHLPWADRYRETGSGQPGPYSYHRMKMGTYTLNDPNIDKWAARELSRWVSATMSPHNPNQHLEHSLHQK